MVLFSRRKTAGVLSALLCCAACQPLCTSAAYYTSNDAVWLRSMPSASVTDNKVYPIPKGASVSISEESFGWGYATYTAPDGTTYQGWTAMYLYSPEEQTTYSEGELNTVSGSRSYIYQYLVNVLGFSAENAQAIFDRMDAVANEKGTTAMGYPTGVEKSDVKKKVYDYLTNTLGLNRASACAVMFNVQEESGFNPYSEIIDSNGETSIGLFQWNGERCEAFKSYCNAREWEYGSVDAQLAFLKYELNNSCYTQYQRMLGFEDTAGGCYEASYFWASNFEVCKASFWEPRAEAAYQYYLK